MNVLIVEDEVLSQKELVRLLNKNFPDLKIVKELTSVVAVIEFFKTNTVDLVFMDIHLADGLCFDIFKSIELNVPIIFVTAYNQYAIKAFKVNSIDYLLKPVDEAELCQAVNKFISLKPTNSSDQITRLLKIYDRSYKSRFTVKVGDNVLFFETKEIAYFYSEYKALYLVTKEGRKYLLDNLSLNSLEELLDPKDFFRLSRNCMASIGAIKSISKHFSSRLKVVLTPEFSEELFISRLRVADFLRWLDGEID